MINKSQKMREAAQISEGSCYIHTEAFKGKAPETILAGDMSLILLGVCAEISRMSELFRTSFEDILKAVLTCKSVGYDEMIKLCELSQDRIIPEVVENDADEEILKLKQKVAKLDEINMRLREQVESDEWIISALKKQKQEIIDSCAKQVKAITKELKKVEHRMKEMEEARFGDDE